MWYEPQPSPRSYLSYPSRTPADWAEIFGRRAIHGMLENAPLEEIRLHARLAGTFGAIALEQAAQWQLQPQQEKRSDVYAQHQ